jgi:hypothetical protein
MIIATLFPFDPTPRTTRLEGNPYMTSHAGNIPVATPSRRARWSAEHRFYVGFATALAAAVFLGISRRSFLRAWYPDWAQAHGAPETFFYLLRDPNRLDDS